jgi:hypothetical protein
MGQSQGGYASNNFYTKIISTDDWVEIPFIGDDGKSFSAGELLLISDTVPKVNFSFDGVNIHGEIKGEGESIPMRNRIRNAIWMKSEISGQPGTIRVFAW